MTQPIFPLIEQGVFFLRDEKSAESTWSLLFGKRLDPCASMARKVDATLSRSFWRHLLGFLQI